MTASFREPIPVGGPGRGPAQAPVTTPDRDARRASVRALVLVLVLIAVSAFAVRLWMMLRGGGLGGIDGYDDGVYYSAATAVSWGRLPYREFVLLHPPGIIAALTPFAVFGRLTHDQWGMELARLCWMLVGALNACLVAWILRRRGLLAAACGGLFYAWWTPVAQTEVTTRLEPMVSLGLLVGLALLMRPRHLLSTRALVFAGLALGFSMSVKIWAVAPVVAILIWSWRRSGRPAAARILVGAVAATVALCLPFFVAAPVDMFRMVILDQLGRGHTSKTLAMRLASISGLHEAGEHGIGWISWLIAGLVVALVVVAARSRNGLARFTVVLLVVQLGVLLLSPSYFSYYAAFIVPALALAVGHGVATLVHLLREAPGPEFGRLGAPGVAVLLAAVVAAVVGLGSIDAVSRAGKPFPSEAIQDLVSTSRCVTSDSPDALALSDVLSRDLSRNCPVMIDVTGLTYDTDALPLLPDGHGVRRALNPKWQHDLMGYLLSGDSILLTRPRADGFSAASQALLGQRTWLDGGTSFTALGGPAGSD